MFLDKHVKDLMIPLKECAITHIDKPLREAVTEMRTVFCEVETGKCTEAGHRMSLVLDNNENMIMSRKRALWENFLLLKI